MRNTEGGKLHSLHSTQQMCALVEHERLRSDRSRQPLSVGVFEVKSPSWWRLRRLGYLILKRARLTDSVGWFGGRSLCAMLPDTAADGAHRFASEVQHRAACHRLGVTFCIYTYPPDDDQTWRGQRHASERAGRFAREPADGFSEIIRELAGASKPTRRPETTAPDRSLGSPDPHSVPAYVIRSGSTLPLMMLVGRRLPWWKRLMDIVGAATGLVLAAPIMAVSGLLIKMTSGGGVIFRQMRRGLRGRPFAILKLRTMVPEAELIKASLRARSEQDGPAFKMTDDPRVTWIGRLLRMTSLDELPQFWNVLIGNMSLVGPRPLPIEEADSCTQWQRRRLDVTPGLTCIWQVRGRSRVKFEDWMRMDMQYVQNRSFLQDLKILLLTVPAVILRRGAH